MIEKELYEIEILNQDGTFSKMKNFKNKVILVINTATHCGFTKQYKELEELYIKYKAKGFEILDFPCNQFAFESPYNDEKINLFCELKFGTTFKRFKKIKVNGKEVTELYKFLKNHANIKKGKRIEWNFCKFLINKRGDEILRFSPKTKPFDLTKEIEKFLK